MKSLASLPARSFATVVAIREGVLAPKLVEMGLFKGCKVVVLFRAPFNGPMAVDIGTSVLSLRLDEAEMVWVEDEISA